MAQLFEQIPDATCLLQKPPGLFVETSVWHLEGRLFAKVGSGFIALKQGNYTSNPKIVCTKLVLPSDEYVRHQFNLYLKGYVDS